MHEPAGHAEHVLQHAVAGDRRRDRGGGSVPGAIGRPRARSIVARLPIGAAQLGDAEVAAEVTEHAGDERCAAPVTIDGRDVRGVPPLGEGRAPMWSRSKPALAIARRIISTTGPQSSTAVVEASTAASAPSTAGPCVGVGSSHTVLPAERPGRRPHPVAAVLGEVVGVEHPAGVTDPAHDRRADARRGTSRRRPRRRRRANRSPSTGLRTVSPSATARPAGAYNGPSTGSPAISAAARPAAAASVGRTSNPSWARRTAGATRSPQRAGAEGAESFLEQPEARRARCTTAAAGRHRVETGGGQGVVGEAPRELARRRRAPPGRRPARRGSGSRRHPARIARARRRTARAAAAAAASIALAPSASRAAPTAVARGSEVAIAACSPSMEMSMLYSVHPADVQEWERCTTTSSASTITSSSHPACGPTGCRPATSEAGPHVVEDDGREYWVYEDARGQTMGLNAVAGKDRDEYSMDPVRFADMIPGCYDPVERAKDLLADGDPRQRLLPDACPASPASLFPTFNDKELADLCVQAYNDFVIDEWCRGGPPGMFVPMIIGQLWDPVLMAAEIRRCADTRRAGAVVPREPGAARPAVVLDRPLGPAVGGLRGDRHRRVHAHRHERRSVPTSPSDSPFIQSIAARCRRSASITSSINLMMSPSPHRSRRSSSCCPRAASAGCRSPSSGPTGMWERHRYWSGVDDVLPVRRLPPQHLGLLHRGAVSASSTRHHIGVDRIMWECDYPHADTPWPHSQKEVAELVRRACPTTRSTMITHGNAERLFRWDAKPDAAALGL